MLPGMRQALRGVRQRVLLRGALLKPPEEHSPPGALKQRPCAEESRGPEAPEAGFLVRAAWWQPGHPLGQAGRVHRLGESAPVAQARAAEPGAMRGPGPERVALARGETTRPAVPDSLAEALERDASTPAPRRLPAGGPACEPLLGRQTAVGPAPRRGGPCPADGTPSAGTALPIPGQDHAASGGFPGQ
jgi:hypothetical protein